MGRGCKGGRPLPEGGGVEVDRAGSARGQRLWAGGSGRSRFGWRARRTRGGLWRRLIAGLDFVTARPEKRGGTSGCAKPDLTERSWVSGARHIYP